MARIETSGADEIIADLENVVRDFPQLRDAMLEAEAKVIEPALRSSVSSARLVRSSGLLSSIKRRKGKAAGVPVIRLGPVGEHHRYFPGSGKTGIVSAGYVGYVGEYGITSRGIPGREWLKKGIERSQGAAFDAAEAVYDNHLKKNDL